MSEPGAITTRSLLVFVLATWPRRLFLGLVLLLPVILAATGGLGAAAPPPRDVPPGVVTDTGAFQVTPHSYFVSDRVDAGSLDEGYRWVGLIAEVTAQGSEPIQIASSGDTFELSDQVPNEERAAPYEVLRLDTGERLGAAQPGLTYEVAMLWRTRGLAEPPPELTFTMNRTEWTRWNIEAGFYSWRATADSYEVTVPVTEAPAVILEEEDE